MLSDKRKIAFLYKEGHVYGFEKSTVPYSHAVTQFFKKWKPQTQFYARNYIQVWIYFYITLVTLHKTGIKKSAITALLNKTEHDE